MPRMVVKATQILQTTASLDVALSIIRLLTKISGDKVCLAAKEAMLARLFLVLSQ